MPSARSKSRRVVRSRTAKSTAGAQAARAALSASVPATALRNCDVFLYDGTGWLAEAIRFFDGTRYNHAGLYLGDESVAEALAPGVIRRGLAESIAGRNEVLVRRLKQDVPDMDPVLERGLAIVREGHRYAYEQLLLLAFLCLTRKVKVTPALRPLIRGALDKAGSLVAGWIGGGRQPMICSEFVFRCYDEALPEAGDIYRLEIGGVPRGGVTRSRAPLGEAAPMPHGRGVHPDSLLAMHASAGARSWSAASRRRPVVRAAAPVVDPDPRSLDPLIQQYLAEARLGVRSRAPQGISDADVAAAVDRFALALSGAGPGTRGPATPEVAVQRLVATAADFVTPGDLFLTDSLFTVGALHVGGD